MNMHNTNTRWLVHIRALLMLRRTMGNLIHKTRHGSNLGEATPLPLIVFFAPLHMGHIQMAFCLRNPKWESQNSHNWDPYDFGGA
jgi:hypothetical protein